MTDNFKAHIFVVDDDRDTLDVTAFTVVEPFSGQRGWFNPNTSEAIRPDHFMFHHINIDDIPNPFI